MRVVVKIGTSSLTNDDGSLRADAVTKIVKEISEVRSAGHEVILVSSGAVASGLYRLGMVERPTDPVRLRAASAIGQVVIMAEYQAQFSYHSLVAGQLLLISSDFADRLQYLHARQTLEALLELGAVPVINENDALSNDQIRYGDNDKVAALVANLISADMLVLLTDQQGLFTADPRLDETASLIEEVSEVDDERVIFATDGGSGRGSGGMAAKIQAAHMASWSGVEAVIAGTEIPGVLTSCVLRRGTVGTRVKPRAKRLAARKLWIAFAAPSRGRVRVDGGARRALEVQGSSLLPAGVKEVEGSFEVGDPVSIIDQDGFPFAKGIARISATETRALMGRRSRDFELGRYLEVVHRDDLVVLT